MRLFYYVECIYISFGLEKGEWEEKNGKKEPARLRWFPEVWKIVVLFPHTTMKVIVYISCSDPSLSSLDVS